ncbi:MAG: cyclopropane-fatty-acyl-phospholipid synthase [Candidatus Solibacter sp.]|nr:cyclopropane-fatty-acyl-phospholipid synthase [Candidatus Solibacter sp.]
MKKLFLRMMEGLEGGSLELVCADRTYRFGDPLAALHAQLVVHRECFFSRALLGGDMGMGEAYMDGDWSSPDLVTLVRLAVRNLARLETTNGIFSALARMADTVRHRLKSNTLTGSRKNIHAHYDLSNQFFQLFLDRAMMYSCAWYETAGDSLETAQRQKLDRICRKLDLGPEDHVLEIGTGWGGFALHAARHYGCKVTTTTISREQHDYALDRFWNDPCGARIELLFEDYRKLRGQYSKLVSIEMFEAVGYEFYDEFFGACDRLLRPDGSMLLQTITINDQKFPAYRKRSDWIQKHIFPGSELASISGMMASLGRATSLGLFHAEDMGAHYARTLAAWRERFHAHAPEVRALGFDERFQRMWDYYLAYCEGAFLERHISVAQLLLTKVGNPRGMMGEPWRAGRETECRETVG